MSRKTPGTVLYLKEVPFDPNQDFTMYKIQLVTVNNQEQEGSPSDSRDLKVARMKTIIAPKIEGITVED